MIGKYIEALDEFMKNHLNVRDFGYLILLKDERVKQEVLSKITEEFWNFWEAREEEDNDVSTIRNEMAANGIQTKKQSLIESLTQTAIGFLVSLFTWYCILWTELFNITVTFADNLVITGIFTVVSIIRGYLIRRFYNSAL